MACGYAGADGDMYVPYAPAPNLGRVYIRADAITGMAQRHSKDLDCTYIQVVGGPRRLVVGTADENLAKIAAAMPYCFALP